MSRYKNFSMDLLSDPLVKAIWKFFCSCIWSPIQLTTKMGRRCLIIDWNCLPLTKTFSFLRAQHCILHSNLVQCVPGQFFKRESTLWCGELQTSFWELMVAGLGMAFCVQIYSFMFCTGVVCVRTRMRMHHAYIHVHAIPRIPNYIETVIVGSSQNRGEILIY